MFNFELKSVRLQTDENVIPMKNLFLLLISVISLFSTGQAASYNLVEQNKFDSLLLLKISINSHDKVLVNNQSSRSDLLADLRIIKEKSVYYALSKTGCYSGATKEPEWKQELTQSQLEKVLDFIRKLQSRAFGTDTFQTGFMMETYRIQYGNQIWNYLLEYHEEGLFDNENNSHKNQIKEPFKIVLNNLYQDIFNTNIQKLRQKRIENRNYVHNLLCKKWYFNPKELENKKRGDILIFSLDSNKEKKEYWKFNKEYTFINSSIVKADTESEYFIKYDGDKISPYMYLSGEQLKVSRSDFKIGQNETSYYILELTETTLKLQIAY